MRFKNVFSDNSYIYFDPYKIDYYNQLSKRYTFLPFTSETYLMFFRLPSCCIQGSFVANSNIYLNKLFNDLCICINKRKNYLYFFCISSCVPRFILNQNDGIRRKRKSLGVVLK